MFPVAEARGSIQQQTTLFEPKYFPNLLWLDVWTDVVHRYEAIATHGKERDLHTEDHRGYQRKIEDMIVRDHLRRTRG